MLLTLALNPLITQIQHLDSVLVSDVATPAGADGRLQQTH
jgi:hypothetical protein